MTSRQHCPAPGIEKLVELAREAGEKILEIYETDFSVEHKDDESPLTAADLASHHTIVEGLEKLTPEIPVLSEESASIPYSERSSWEQYWLIDPLDGTREFVKRNGEFTVNIAFIDNGEPVAGVIYVPVTGLTYYACRGGGAWKLAPGEEQAERIHVSELGERPINVAGSRSHRGDTLNGFLSRIGEYDIISMGSSLKSCLVAEGKADLYPRLGPTSEWDTAAAQAIVEEAGGRMTDTQMRPLRYNTKESLLNPSFFAFGADSRDWASYL